MSLVAEMPISEHSFLDDLTPESGLSLRLWSQEEFRRMASSVLFRADESLVLVDGEICLAPEHIIRRFHRDEYYRLAEQGILKPEERTELIYGRIIERMSPMGRPHNIALSKAAATLAMVFGEGYTVEQQMSMQLGSGIEPQPDIMVLPGTSEDYPDAPLASDVTLVVEISDTTLRYDRGTKAKLYAAAEVQEYWLVNLRGRTLEIRRLAEHGQFKNVEVYAEGQIVAPHSLPNATVRVADLLPLVR